MNTAVISLDGPSKVTCVVVGLGLLGDAVARELLSSQQATGLNTHFLKLDWQQPARAVQILIRTIEETPTDRIELVWCAGKAGFLSSDVQLAPEYKTYRDIVSALGHALDGRLIVNLLSTAGGLYEGSGRINHIDDVSALRPYGVWKLKQEQLLAELALPSRVFRASTVYGRYRAAQRAGLVSVLLSAAFDGSVAEVFASPNTLRDFIFADDVARFIVHAIRAEQLTGPCLLASGRPCSVDRLVKLVSGVTRRKVRVQYRSKLENQADIVFPKCLLPDQFRVTTLEESVRLLSRQRAGGVQGANPVWPDIFAA